MYLPGQVFQLTVFNKLVTMETTFVKELTS